VKWIGDRYELSERLGHGGMATVYLAHDHKLDREVAIKLLADNLAGDDELRTRFSREARLAARLDHPNVVQVFDVGEEDGRPYIVMEYVEGGTVGDRLGRRRRSLATNEAVQLLAQLCDGLGHAHAKKLVHRDIKPQNLLLREADGCLKITDFGIARAGDTTQLTKQGTILGTAAYFAPEQAAGESVGPAADIYAIGAVLYELLTGRPPHHFDSLAELGELQRGGMITPPRDLETSIPRKLEAAVMRALARDPDFRPSSAAEFAQELAGATEREAQTQALPAGRYRSTSRRRRWIALAFVAAIAVVAAALAIVRSGDDGSSPPPPPPAPISAPARGATPANEARNLSAWLRAHSR
jgi:serine/threonine-protein kinase